MKNQATFIAPGILAVLMTTAGLVEAAQGSNESNVLKYYNRLETRVDNHETRLQKLEVETEVDGEEPRQFSASVNTASANLSNKMVATKVTTASAPKVVQVKSGDTLSKLAKVHQTTVSKLMKLNKLNDQSVLRIGQSIVVGTTTVTKKEPVETTVVTNREPQPAPNYIQHEVQRGETVNKLARLYNVPASAIFTANRMTESSVLLPGRVLMIPGKGKSVSNQTEVVTKNVPVTNSRASYEVKGKDTFYSLASSNGISVNELMAANPGVNPNKLRPGTIIKIPVRPIAKGRTLENTQPVETEEDSQFRARDLHQSRNIQQTKGQSNRGGFETTKLVDDQTQITRNSVDPYFDYTVEPSDSWSSIAQQFRTSQDEVKRINGARNGEEPAVGATIQVPRTRLGVTPASRAGNKLG
jgi:peptidoglycan DL-endopeptidase LytF